MNRKRRRWTFLLLAFLVFTTPAAAQCTNPPAGLVAWWSGDGHGFDLVGGQHATPMGGVGFAPGMVGRSFAFETTNDWTQLTTNRASLTQTTGTVEFWVKVISLQENTVRLFSVSEAGMAYPTADTWAVDYRGDGAVAGAIQVNLVAGGTIVMSAFTPANSIADTNWHHIAVVADGADPLEIYVDGVSQTLSGIFGSTADRFFGHAVNADVMAAGAIIREVAYAEGIKQIDEVSVYDRPLNAAEIAAIFAAGNGGKCKPPFPAPLGLVNWWRGENSPRDLISTNHGSPAGPVAYVPGKVGQAFSFNGTDTSLDMGPVFANAGTFTFEWWMYLRRFTHEAYTPVFCQPCATQSPECIPGAFWFYAGNETSYGSFRFGATWRDNTWNDLHSLIPFGTGTWEHVALTYDGNELRLYWNGQLYGQASAGEHALGNSSPFWVGKAFVPHSNGNHETTWLDGLVDELSVYNRALPPEEIAAISEAGSAGKSPGPTLSAAHASNGIRFTWPAVYNGYRLVSCANLKGGVWEEAADVPTVKGIWNELLLPVTNSHRFFRLDSGH